MKILPIALASALLTFPAFAADATGSFGLHLFFDEQEFIDVLTLSHAPDGKLQGHMSVPKDFEGEIEAISENDKSIAFDLRVPKNKSRPSDLLFHYEGRYFDSGKSQITGFVTLKNQSAFVASFVAIRRTGN